MPAIWAAAQRRWLDKRKGENLEPVAVATAARGDRLVDANGRQIGVVLGIDDSIKGKPKLIADVSGLRWIFNLSDGVDPASDRLPAYPALAAKSGRRIAGPTLRLMRQD